MVQTQDNSLYPVIWNKCTFPNYKCGCDFHPSVEYHQPHLQCEKDDLKWAHLLERSKCSYKDGTKLLLLSIDPWD